MKLFSKLFSSKSKFGCDHDYGVVAYDYGFTTIYTDTNETVTNHVVWRKCRTCGHRDFESDASEKHAGINTVRHRWIEQNVIHVSNKGEVFSISKTIN